MLTAVGTDSDWTAKWLLASSAFVDAFEIVAKHGYIAYWQDTLGITLFTMGEFCLKVRRSFSSTQSAPQAPEDRMFTMSAPIDIRKALSRRPARYLGLDGTK